MDFKHDSNHYSGCLPNTLLSRFLKTISLLSALLVVLSMFGCITSSISESSDSLSGSVKSSSKSSNSSSEENKESYLRDIKQYTAVYSRSSSDISGLVRGLSTISEKYGVTNWEAYNATYQGIGEGFAKAAVSQEQADAYIVYLAQGDKVKVAAIQQGFRQGQ